MVVRIGGENGGGDCVCELTGGCGTIGSDPDFQNIINIVQ